MGPLAGDMFDTIDEQDLVFTLNGLVAVKHHHTGFHRRVIEQIRTQADHCFDNVRLDHLLTDGLFRVTEQHAVGPEHGGAAGVGLQAFDDMGVKAVVGATLRWHAV
ncbi:hypothetical protein D3C85_1561780 [compost metagenome]